MSLDTGVGDGSADADVLAELFYPVFELLFDPDGDFVGDVERKLAEARMPDQVEMYVSRALGVGLLVGGLLWALGTLIGYGVFSLGLIDPSALSLGMPAPTPAIRDLLRSLVVPTAVLISGLVFGSIGFALGFGALVAVPYSRASSRKREINLLLADSVSFMYALSVGGLNQLEILRAMATAEDTYGEVSREFQSIVNETEYFGTDYRNAIRQQSMETPSDELSQFLADMLSIVNSGGDMEGFLKDKKEKHLRTSKQEREMTLETLELFGEMYMTLSLFPLLLIIILVIMGMMGEADDRLLYVTVYLLIPLVGVGFLDYADNALNSVYFCYDPDFDKRNPGTFSILQEIERTRLMGLSHYYLGYIIPGCRNMLYKDYFRPRQYLNWQSGTWEGVTAAPGVLQEREKEI